MIRLDEIPEVDYDLVEIDLSEPSAPHVMPESHLDEQLK